jgi:hypothetical protein
VETKTITFGKDGNDNDVYVYDATGKVYYAKGYYVEQGGILFRCFNKRRINNKCKEKV